MELRGCSQMHFISAIRGGEVIKVPNVVRGGPEPKYLSIVEIYSSIDLGCQNSVAKCPPKVDRSLAMTCGIQVKTEVKCEWEEEEDRLDYGAMTLRQLKNICKFRKRKASGSTNLTTVKLEDNDLQCDEGERDLNETLGSLKRKAVMKTKAKKKCLFNSKICKSLKIEVEDAEHDPTTLKARSLTVNDNPGYSSSDSVCAAEPSFSDQDPDIMSGNMQSNVLVQSSRKPLVQAVPIENSFCYLNEVSYKELDNDELQNPLVFKHPKIEVTMKVESSMAGGDQSLAFCGSEDRRDEGMTDLMACDKPTEMAENISSDIQNHYFHNLSPPQPLSAGNNSSEFHGPSMDNDGECEDATVTNIGEAIAMVESETMSAQSTICDATVKFGHLSSDHGIAFPYTLTSTFEEEQFLVPAVMGSENNCHDNIEFIQPDMVSRSLGDNPDSEAKAILRNIKDCKVALQDGNCMPLVNSVESLQNVTSAVENNQSLIPENDIGTRTCSDIQPCTSFDQQIGSEASEGCSEKELLEQPPERLLSSRKTISPNSKERLRRAMDLAEMQDDTQNLSCREKLFFEKDFVDTSRPSGRKNRIIFTSKRMQALHGNEIKADRHSLKKGRFVKNLSSFRGSGRGSHDSPSLHPGSGCNSSLSCTQNAVGFSQQQMNDIERIATKLLIELQTMKELVVDTVHSESRTCTPSRNNIDKARVAVENVKRVEENTRRWLSIMKRDCIRFCKILEEGEKKGSSPGKSTDKDSQEICEDSPDSGAQKDVAEVSPSKRTANRDRKIIFADEAGENLCSVRVLEAKQDEHGCCLSN